MSGGHRSKVHSLAWNVAGSKLASASLDHTIRIWPTERLGQDSSELRGHAGSIDQVSWSPTAELLASASSDRTVRIWDVTKMTCVGSLPTSSDNLTVSWSGDGERVAVGSRDDTLTVFNIRMMTIEGRRKFEQEINETAWAPDGRILMTRGSGQVDIIDAVTLEIVESLPAHTSNCYCISFDPSKRYFAVGAADALASVWEYAQRACIRTFSRLDWPIRAVSFSGDGEVLATASEDSFIDVAAVKTGESIYKIPTTAPINTLTWNPTKPILAYAADHGDTRSSKTPLGSIYILDCTLCER